MTEHGIQPAATQKPVAAHAQAADSTSTERTHRYLRLAIGGTVVVIIVSILLTVPSVGWLPSVSDYFYTPARNAFVGAVIAASLALLALSGRGAERIILDAAAVFAPIVALVPSVISPGSVPGVEVECAKCVPAAFEPDVVNGVTTYLVILAGILLLGIALSIVGAVQGAVISLLLGGVVFAIVLITGLAIPELFLGWAHFLATTVFFGLIAADAILNAFWRTSSTPPPKWLRIVYLGIAAVMIVDLVALVVATIATASAPTDTAAEIFPWIFVGEVIALLAFLAFWWLQTWQRWDEADPASLVAATVRLPPLSE